jgi:Calcineurin-like phosphoesterase
MRKILTAVVVLGVTGWLSASGQSERPKGDHGHRAASGTNYFNVTVPPHAVDIILARPEDRSVTVSVLAYQVMAGAIWYGTQPETLTSQTKLIAMPMGEPANFRLQNLSPNTAYYGQFRWLEKKNSSAEFVTNNIPFRFHTARATGSPFTFTLTADAHLDEHTSAQVYEQTLANIRAEAPDFHIDLGNLFMTDKHATRDEAWRQYLAQRYYLNQLGSPLFLALGVHDGEASRYDDGSPDNLAVQSNANRKKYFPNPDPDNFYTGNATRHAQSGLLENYFAWTWGDALFVVLDPYRYSLRSGGRNSDGWSWSLGREQYDWLARTLAASRAKYKFVFLHNLLAGDQSSRGGVEIAPFNEWGGKNPDGTDGWAQHRPGWPLPVHQLLLKNRVTAVFRAHDNFYARQELDGLPYIMVPQPSFAGNDRIRDLQTYGYKTGVFLGNSGHVRVTVAPDKVTEEYVKSGSAANVADACTLRQCSQ